MRLRENSRLLSPNRRFVAKFLCIAFLGAASGVPAAAQVFEMTGGGSSLFQGEGGSLHVYGNSYSARFDLGVLDGSPRVGFLLEAPIRGFSWGLGDQTFSFTLPTDLFTPAFLYGRGVSALRKDATSSLFMFAGATSRQFFVPFLSAANIDTPVGVLFYERQLAPRVRFFSQNVISGQQTSIQSLQWKFDKGTTLGIGAGIGGNQYYAASSISLDRRWLVFRGSYALAGKTFQRIRSTVTPMTESNRENLRLDLIPSAHFRFSAVRQNLLSQSFPIGGPSLRAAVNGLSASTSGLLGFQINSSFFESQSRFGRSEGILGGFRREVGRHFDAGVDVFRNKFGHFASTATATTVHERVNQRLTFTQAIMRSGGQNSVSYGGQLSSNLLSVGVDYLTLFLPVGFAGRGGFQQTMQVNLRFQLRNARLQFSTNTTTFGRTAYTAYGTGYAYGKPVEGRAPASSGGSLAKYVIQGQVVDEAGRPIHGAALRIDRQIVFTDSGGIFSARERKEKEYPVEILFDQFMFPGTYRLVVGPSTVKANPEKQSVPSRFVIRRIQ